MEALGFISHYGLTPAIDFFRDTDITLNVPDTEENAEHHKELNILVSECADIRHIMKSLAD